MIEKKKASYPRLPEYARVLYYFPFWVLAFPGGTSGKESAFQCRRHRVTGSVPGSGRSPGGGHGNPFQYSCLENPMDTGTLWATVHWIAKSWTQLKQLNTHQQWKQKSLPTKTFTELFMGEMYDVWVLP